MNKTTAFLLLALIVALGVMFRILISRPETKAISQRLAPQTVERIQESKNPVQLPASRLTPEIPVVKPAIIPAVETVKAQARTNLIASPIPTSSPQELADPAARVALSLVGVDPAAEQYWLAAIFDPSLPAKEREDLMEDLNEVGLSDPKNPSREDLQLIWIRLGRIEAIAPYTDEFMGEHLGEAYKDLYNLASGGHPQ